MAVTPHNMAEQIIQLDAARNLVLGDANFYGQIVEGILPIIGANARLELRRWGADFLAETFASPTLAPAQKEKLSLQVLATLKDLLEVPGEDTAVVKSVVQTAASVYPIVFRHIIENPDEAWVWEKMAAIKSNILRRWDTAPIGVRICCIRFVQKVVQVQTPGVITDPRRPELNETSLALVPRRHPLIPPPNLEAEASGLLDRLLNVFQENSSDAILITATLNGLSVLIRTRPAVANKIISAILSFNPLKQANSPMTPRVRVVVKSMERTTRAFLINVNKRNPSGPLAGKIHQYIERLIQSRNEIFDEGSRKRPAPSEAHDGQEHAKRARLSASVKPIPPLPPGPTSFAQLFTLTDDVGLSTFDVQQLPIELVTKIAAPVLARIDEAALNEAINAVRSRCLTISREQHITPALGAPAGVDDDDDDDYEPDYQPPIEDAEQILNKIDADGGDELLQQPEIALGSFKLPQPPPLTPEETAVVGKGTVGRVLGMISAYEDTSLALKRQQKLGLNRLAGSNYDKDAWTTVITRLATRSAVDLDSEDSIDYQTMQENKLQKRTTSSISTTIRESLYHYILEDFRRRIDIAITWLTEEWFNEQIHLKTQLFYSRASDSPSLQSPYEYYIRGLLSSLLPYLDSRTDTKLLIRFLSEIPSLPPTILSLVASLAKDPERVGLCVSALHYLVLMRPPAREAALDTLEEIWRDEEGARKAVEKVLGKWRPAVLKEEKVVNGVKREGGEVDGQGLVEAISVKVEAVGEAVAAAG